MALDRGTRIGPYEVTAPLGSGGMGEVYLAADTKLKRQVALKVLSAAVADDPERLARLQREAEMLAALNHPNIAAIYGLEDTTDTIALVMELVDGPTLEDVLAAPSTKGKGLALADVLAIAKQIADALEAAHDRGIIHRDLKPGNIKVRADGTVKVLDFGLAKAVETASPSTQASIAPTMVTPEMTMQGAIVGTPAYMSPEQARGRAVDRRTDVWAFGAVLFEMLSGQRAFPGDDASQMLARVIEREPDWSLLPASVPPHVKQAIRVCLTKDPKKRPSDVLAVRLALDGMFQPPAEPSADAPPTRRQATGRALWTAATTALLVGAAVGALAWRAFDAPRPAKGAARFVITGPASRPVFVSNAARSVALSPDGIRLAYAALNVADPITNAALQIYTRTLNSLETVPVRGTEGGGTSPFFSPDGSQIGFVNALDNSLRRVPADGGPPITIAKFGTIPLGAVWAPDGTILFTLSGSGGTGTLPLMRISAEGGDAKPLTHVDESAGDAAHVGANVLPGGTDAVFTILKASQARLALVSLKTGVVTDLKISGSDPFYSRTGHLIYSVGDGTLRAIPFDARRLAATTGSPVTVQEGLNAQGGKVQFAVSSDADSLAYVSGNPNVATPQRTLVWVDRSGREEPIGVPPKAYATPRISPDGTRVAVAIDGDLWVTDLARPGTLQRVTSDPARERFPLWTPDSTRLVFESNKSGGPQILSVAADGRGDAIPVLTDPPKEWDLLSPETWSADGRDLLFIYRRKGETAFNIGRLTTGSGQSPKPLLDTKASESNAVVSKDGRWIAYEADDSGQAEVYVESFPTLGGRQILSTGGGKNPLWSRDGRELFYRRGPGGQDGPMMASEVRTTPTFTMGPGRQLFSGKYYSVAVGARTWDLAPDGRFLMMKAVENDPSTLPQVVLVERWSDELRRRFAPK